MAVIQHNRIFMQKRIRNIILGMVVLVSLYILFGITQFQSRFHLINETNNIIGIPIDDVDWLIAGGASVIAGGKDRDILLISPGDLQRLAPNKSIVVLHLKDWDLKNTVVSQAPFKEGERVWPYPNNPLSNSAPTGYTMKLVFSGVHIKYPFYRPCFFLCSERIDNGWIMDDSYTGRLQLIIENVDQKVRIPLIQQWIFNKNWIPSLEGAWLANSRYFLFEGLAWGDLRLFVIDAMDSVQ